MRALLTVVALLTPMAAAEAATVTATPETARAVILESAPGDTIILGAGSYPPTTFIGLRRAPAITLDARKADQLVRWAFVGGPEGIRILGGTWNNGCALARAGCSTSALTFTGTVKADQSPNWDCRDITVTRAAFTGPYRADAEGYLPGDGYGLFFTNCTDFTVGGLTDPANGNTFSGFKTGLLFASSRRGLAAGNDFRHMRSDGFNCAQCWSIEFAKNTARDFRITSTEHPDFAQWWSRPYWPRSCTPAPPTSDTYAHDNYGMVASQGLFAGNHTRPDSCNGNVLKDDGGFDRMRFENNLIWGVYGRAISVSAGRETTMKNNHVWTLAGAPMIANLYYTGNTFAEPPCGNVVEPGAGKQGWSDTPCAGTRRPPRRPH